MAHVSPLLAWLQEPDTERGIRFARAGDGWDRWSYERLATLSIRVASGLIDAGVRRGEVVTIVERSSPNFVASLFGAMLAGATPSPMAPPIVFQDEGEYAGHGARLLGTSQPSMILTGTALRETVAPLAEQARVSLVEIEKLIATPADPRGPSEPAELALLQFTSGTSGYARGVRVPLCSLEANVQAIHRWLAMTRTDATASWLPVHHDMGLIGCLLTPVANRSDIWLMSPEQFVRSPLRYLRCFDTDGARLTAMPGFGLSYIAGRVTHEDLHGLDLGAWRAIIVGAERLDPQAFEQFHQLLASAGLSRCALLPAYGLAEATLAVTGLALHDRWRSVEIDPATVALGAKLEPHAGRNAQLVLGCGRSLEGVETTVCDADGVPLTDRVVGEIFVAGNSLAADYATPDDGSSLTTIADGIVRTGDAGFMLDGELFVLGRLGDALKIRGRAVFAEELEALLAGLGVPAHRVAAVLGERLGEPTLVLVLEDAEELWIARAMPLLRRRTAGANMIFVDAPRGTIERTSSGKPRRRNLWTAFLEDRLPGSVLRDLPTDHRRRGAHA
ncbi:MAG TPA: AMP-binding protein [Solirubrobacteraceae bacterium]|jgi:acyl-CoA synthetase (AMP-forming)/AMP-acid ligase II|nr:AMP-binding protein [Solirubrobacteraceae bacterium]